MRACVCVHLEGVEGVEVWKWWCWCCTVVVVDERPAADGGLALSSALRWRVLNLFSFIYSNKLLLVLLKKLVYSHLF